MEYTTHVVHWFKFEAELTYIGGLLSEEYSKCSLKSTDSIWRWNSTDQYSRQWRDVDLNNDGSYTAVL